jgi:hypothetical protein
MSQNKTFSGPEPTPDTDDGFMLERPLSMPTCGSLKTDMRSEISFDILEELTGVDVKALHSQNYEEERIFWRQFFAETKTMPKDHIHKVTAA